MTVEEVTIDERGMHTYLILCLAVSGMFNMLYLKAFGAFYYNGDNLRLEDTWSRYRVLHMGVKQHAVVCRYRRCTLYRKDVLLFGILVMP